MIRAIWLARTVAMVACLVPSSQTLAQKPDPEIIEIISVQESASPGPVTAPTPLPDGTQPPFPSGDQASWVTTDDYPEAAWAEHRYGVTTMELTVGRDGRVTGCRVIISSKSSDLDTAACAALTERARFEPARDRRGRAIAGTFTKRVRWQLPELPVISDPMEGYADAQGVIVRVHVNQANEVDYCEVSGPSADSVDENDQIVATRCAAVRRMVGSAPPNPPLASSGLWLEFRDLMYIYRANPNWPATDAPAEVTPAPLPPVTTPEPLPEGVT